MVFKKGGRSEEEIEAEEAKDQEIMDKLDLDKKFPEFKGWEMIGFHRQLGSEFWSILLNLISTGLTVIMAAYLVPLISPYPEVGGYGGIAGGLFSVIFLIFDVPTNFGIGNFIAENRVKNPEKMMEYIRFFIWWQMFSGLIQVTGLSIFTFEVIVTGNYAYLTWLLLLILQRQWPSMLGIYRGCIDGFQHFDKSNLLNFLCGTVVGQLMNIAIVLFGRHYGMTHPEVGEIMAMAIAGSIGGYINDILFFIVSAYFFNKIVKNMGLSARDAWRFKFGRDVVRRSLSYGFQCSVVPLVSGGTGLLFLLWKTSQIPGFVTWSALVGTASGMTGMVGSYGNYNLSAALAEAYPNGKKVLASFYVSYAMMFRLMFVTVFAMSLAAIYPFFSDIYHEVSGLVYWVPALIFYYPTLIRKLFDPFVWLPDSVMGGTFKIPQWAVARVVEEGIKVLNLYLALFVFNVQDMGIFGVNFLITFDMIIPIMIKTIYCIVYCHVKVVKIKIYWMKSVVLPAIAALPIVPFALVWYNYVFLPMCVGIGVIVAATVSIIAAFLVMMFIVFFPLYALIGGFDDYMLYVFTKAVDLSGPSKPMTRVILRIIVKCCKVGKKIGTYGKFVIPYEEAHKEIEELMQLKKEGKFVVLKK
ncbi:MAG: hypothetical protein JW839_06235 [Candidatus Lokiarchaeota archaeon]|nr:hypothetical protein [Candidatus Lokiarchaeota archaeon]